MWIIDDMSIDDILLMCEDAACTALDGCPSLTFNKIASLLDNIVNITPSLDPGFLLHFKLVLASIIEAQERSDFYKLADIINFELHPLISESRLNVQ